ncbi:serine hydrolase [Kribbella sp. NPDC051770]|uniref:serine hydrolase domain-containing protein n=1 Tax=Kribbella sp. NPDC051770 TaxID=3155413 RepID=UPI00342D6035
MRRPIATFVVLLALAGCAPGVGRSARSPAPTPTIAAVTQFPAPATTPLDPGKAVSLQAVLDKVVSQYAALPDSESASRGVTAAVLTDRWSWSGAAGRDAAGSRLTPDTSFGVASITKTFVAAEVLLLAQRGALDLDAPLSAYVKHPLTANNATVRQHLAMRSGVPNYRNEDYAKVDRAIAAAPGRHWTAEEALSYATAAPNAPDSAYSYSNPSYVLLGMLIEKVSGQPLAVALRRDLATVAGLERAAFQDHEKPRPPLAEDRNVVCGRAVDGFTPCRAFASLSAANAGMAADAPSVARWGYQLYGSRVIPGELVRQMTDGAGEYGLGTMLYSNAFGIHSAVGHRGASPDVSSILVVVPDQRLALAVLLADGNKVPDTVAASLITAIEPLLAR